jgi:hypothetical protein
MLAVLHLWNITTAIIFLLFFQSRLKYIDEKRQQNVVVGFVFAGLMSMALVFFLYYAYPPVLERTFSRWDFVYHTLVVGLVEETGKFLAFLFILHTIGNLKEPQDGVIFTKGRWEEMPWVAKRAPEGWKAAHQRDGVADDLGYEPLSDGDEEVTVDPRKRAWARLLAKVYEVDPMVCPKCGRDMKVIAVIEDPDELSRILRHLVKMGRSPPGFDPDRLS